MASRVAAIIVIHSYTISSLHPRRDLVVADRQRGPNLDVSKTPFRLIAIVNRIDLADNPATAGVPTRARCASSSA